MYICPSKNKNMIQTPFCFNVDNLYKRYLLTTNDETSFKSTGQILSLIKLENVKN